MIHSSSCAEFEIISSDISAQLKLLYPPAVNGASSTLVPALASVCKLLAPGAPAWCKSLRLPTLWTFPRFPKLATFTIDPIFPLRLGILCIFIPSGSCKLATSCIRCFVTPETSRQRDWRAFDESMRTIPFIFAPDAMRLSAASAALTATVSA